MRTAQLISFTPVRLILRTLGLQLPRRSQTPPKTYHRTNCKPRLLNSKKTGMRKNPKKKPNRPILKTRRGPRRQKINPRKSLRSQRNYRQNLRPKKLPNGLK